MEQYRLGRDMYFMIMAIAASARGTCPRRSVGAVMTKDGHIISTGYNGTPKGMTHCNENNCLMHHGSCINTIHGEANCIANARDTGDTFYTTDQPCLNCLKLILAHNSRMRIVFWREYKDESRDLWMKQHPPAGYSLTDIPHNEFNHVRLLAVYDAIRL